MKNILSLLLLAALTTTLNAQSYQLPDYEFKSAEDYTTYANDFVAALEWFETTKHKDSFPLRQEVSAFLLKWLEGTPTVTLELKAEVVTFMDAPELFLLYMAGWGRYAIQNNSKDKAAGSLAGVETAMNYYIQNKADFGKNKEMDKYVKMHEKGKLKKFMERQF